MERKEVVVATPCTPKIMVEGGTWHWVRITEPPAGIPETLVVTRLVAPDQNSSPKNTVAVPEFAQYKITGVEPNVEAVLVGDGVQSERMVVKRSNGLPCDRNSHTFSFSIMWPQGGPYDPPLLIGFRSKA